MLGVAIQFTDPRASRNPQPRRSSPAHASRGYQAGSSPEVGSVEQLPIAFRQLLSECLQARRRKNTRVLGTRPAGNR
jgi:hypothetical protein